MAKRSGFTLVELLVVITILAIISVVAYTQFGGVTDKAKNSSKLDHIASIQGALEMFNQQNNYYPLPSTYSNTNNVWGYDPSVIAQPSNGIDVSKDVNGNIITATGTLSKGGGKVMGINSNSGNQVGAKGTVDATVLTKQYLSQELADPSLKDTKVGNSGVFKDFGIGEYVYSVYSKPAAAASWNGLGTASAGKKGSAYQVAATLSDDQKTAVTKITGNYDTTIGVDLPSSLVGSGTVNLSDGSVISAAATATGVNQGVPYPISGF